MYGWKWISFCKPFRSASALADAIAFACWSFAVSLLKCPSRDPEGNTQLIQHRITRSGEQKAQVYEKAINEMVRRLDYPEVG
jgi:hypothetical protein